MTDSIVYIADKNTAYSESTVCFKPNSPGLAISINYALAFSA